MKPVYFIILTTLIGHLGAQNKSNGSNGGSFNRFQIGMLVSPDYCFRTLKNNDGSESSDIVIKLNNEREVPKFGFTTGLNVCYNLNSNIGIESGIQYSNKGYQTKIVYGMMGGPGQFEPIESKFKYNFHCIDIPLKLNFAAGTGNVRFISSLGITTNFFVKETQILYVYNPGSTDKSSGPSGFDYNNVNISPTVSVGIDYKIKDGMNLRIEPAFRYTILKIIDSPVTGYLYSGGINIGYYVGF
jgi:opacity protein-like surface antigen